MTRISRWGLALALVLAIVLVAGAPVLGAGSIGLVVNGRTIACDVPPQNIDGRVLVPIRAVSEALGCQVQWNQANQQVLVTAAGGTGSGSASGSGSGSGAGSGAGITVFDASSVYAQASPSVVAILCYAVSDGVESINGFGSGFIISADGDVVTNAHVVAGCTRLTVLVQDGRAFDVSSEVLSDELSDVALVRLRTSGLTPLALGDSSQLSPGDPVIAIGNPAMMQLRNSVSAGIVSGIARQVEFSWYPAIQTDAVINHGNSGGPLINAKGQAIGITTWKVVDASVEGLGFAIPSNTVQEILAELKEHGRVIRPWLGLKPESSLEAQYGLPTDKGLTVVSVDNNGPAQVAGIRSGDELVAFDGQPTHSLVDLFTLLLSHKPGDVVTLTVRRAGVTQECRVTLGERP